MCVLLVRTNPGAVVEFGVALWGGGGRGWWWRPRILSSTKTLSRIHDS